MLAAWLLGAAALGMRLLVGHRRMARLRSAGHPCRARGRGALPRPRPANAPEPPSGPSFSVPVQSLPGRPAPAGDPAAGGRRAEPARYLRPRAGPPGPPRRALEPAATLATAVFWVQPLLWVLSRRMEETAEEVCDDFVVEFGADRGRYAGHLLELAERRLPPLAPSGVGMISLRSLLARRIARILDSTRSLSTRAGRRAIAATLLAGLAGTLLAGCSASVVGIARSSGTSRRSGRRQPPIKRPYRRPRKLRSPRTTGP